MIKHETGIDTNHTIVDWCNFLLEECETWLANNPHEIGGMVANGNPLVIESDESEYFLRKYYRGQWREGHWIFRDPKFFMLLRCRKMGICSEQRSRDGDQTDRIVGATVCISSITSQTSSFPSPSCSPFVLGTMPCVDFTSETPGSRSVQTTMEGPLFLPSSSGHKH
ncbi:hypothetical protein PoB_000649300 [Plakobranchus ocellatus]|uniref:Uncharacterized protein n=1 Tax=Plakobranchus ocellatus TaxID=259542 RepID=A0AAV3YCX5_9GAST|nr:hypothetical protein PoB_000649300 [Plakobranchus ocellatus]